MTTARDQALALIEEYATARAHLGPSKDDAKPSRPLGPIVMDMLRALDALRCGAPVVPPRVRIEQRCRRCRETGHKADRCPQPEAT